MPSSVGDSANQGYIQIFIGDGDSNFRFAAHNYARWDGLNYDDSDLDGLKDPNIPEQLAIEFVGAGGDVMPSGFICRHHDDVRAIVIGDVDNNGRADIVAGGWDSSKQLYLNEKNASSGRTNQFAKAGTCSNATPFRIERQTSQQNREAVEFVFRHVLHLPRLLARAQQARGHQLRRLLT